MQIDKIRFHSAGNVHFRTPAIEVRFSLSADGSETLPRAIFTRLRASLPPQRDDAMDFPLWRELTKTRRRIPATRLVEAVALVLQRSIHWPVIRSGDADDRAVFETRHRQLGRSVARLAVSFVSNVIAGEEPETLRETFAQDVSTALRKHARSLPGFDALAVAQGAEARDIPWQIVPNAPYIRLGSGRHAKVLDGAQSSQTSLMGRKIAKNKAAANAVLASAGLPAVQQIAVSSLRKAQLAAQKLGFPVVVKPAKGKGGKGVSVDLTSADDVDRAYQLARAVSRSVVVEKMLAGQEVRLLVIGGKFIAASHRRAARVVGDGRHSIKELVTKTNRQPDRLPMPASTLGGPHAAGVG